MTFLGDKPVIAWLAMCFGACLRPTYTAVPNKELRESATKAVPLEPKRPTTNWRDIPLVSKYELRKQIGKGGFSEIWLAQRRDTAAGGGSGVSGPEAAPVALKVVQLANPDLEPEEVTTLLAESKFLRSLDCPYLLHCYETAATEDWLVLVLEYLPGGEIMDHIHKVTKYTEAEAAKLFAQVVSAISYLHNLNLIHRDIKPENVMFTTPVEECEAAGRPLRVKVIDLGMAALYDPDKPIRGCIGTPGFVSPELWNDSPHTPACDIYALGVVLFIMLTGRKPHSGADIRMMTYCNKSIREAPGLVDERFLSLSSAARELLLAMLADDPRVRPSCMGVLSHPFITAVDSNKEAHREMENSVRRRMRELAQLRRVHGLRYALRVQKPQGADHLAFLQVLDQRRLKLKGDSGAFARISEANGPAFRRPSYLDGGAAPFGRPSYADGGGGGGGFPAFARSSLAASYAMPPPVLMMKPDRHPHPSTSAGSSQLATSTMPTRASTAVSPSDASNAAAVAAASGAAATSGAATLAPPFSLPHLGSSARGGGGGGGHVIAHSAPATPLSLLQPIFEQSSPPLPLPPQLAAAAAADAAAARRGGQGPPPPGPLTDSRCDTPDGHSRDLGAPVPDGLAARPPAAFAISLPVSGSGGRSSHAGGHKRLTIDPMAVVNALPTLKHCQSADALTTLGAGVRAGGGGGGAGGDGDDGEMPLDGGSPVERAAVVERAMMTRCMSANPDTLELLGHQESLQLFLQGVAEASELESRTELLASAYGYNQQQHYQQQPQQYP